MPLHIENRFERLISRLKDLRPRVFVGGEEFKNSWYLRPDIYSKNFSLGSSIEDSIRADPKNLIMLEINGGAAKSWPISIDQLKFNKIPTSEFTPCFSTWQELLPVLGNLFSKNFEVKENIQMLAGASEYQVCLLNSDGKEISLYKRKISNLFLDSGVYWLLISATSWSNLPVKIFIPIILGEWDGYTASERNQMKSAIVDWNEKNRDKWWKFLPNHISDLDTYIESGIASWKWLNEQVDAIVRQDIQARELLQRELEEASNRVNLRIANQKLNLPRSPRNDRDFEEIVRDWMIAFGHHDACLTKQGPDSGIDVFGANFVAQVKFYSSEPVGREAIQLLKGASTLSGDVWVLFFAYANGFRETATEWATKANVALFVFDVDSRTFGSGNLVADEFFRIHGSYKD